MLVSETDMCGKSLLQVVVATTAEMLFANGMLSKQASAEISDGSRMSGVARERAAALPSTSTGAKGHAYVADDNAAIDGALDTAMVLYSCCW